MARHPEVEAHIVAQARLRALLEQAITRIWGNLPGYNRENVDEFLSRALPAIDAGRRQSISLTDAYLARYMRRAPYGVDPTPIAAKIRNGTPPGEIYTRPFVETWTALKAGTPWQEAVKMGLDRAVSSAATDMQLAMRGAASEIGQLDPRITGYARVTDGAACDLCVIAASQTYRTEDLMPIHNHCGCSVEPLTDGQEPSMDLYREIKGSGGVEKITAQRARSRAESLSEKLANTSDPNRRAALERQIKNANDTAKSAQERYEQLRDTTVAVRDHGELGPVLTDAAHEFTHL